MRSARAYLMPFTEPRSEAFIEASRSMSECSASRVMAKPCTPLEGSPASACAAAARLRIVPPMPTIRRPLRGSQAASFSSSSATYARSALRAFFGGGSSSARKCSVMRTAPSGQEPRRPGWRLRTSTSCSDPPPRSSTAPSVSVVEFTAAR